VDSAKKVRRLRSSGERNLSCMLAAIHQRGHILVQSQA
jgi:hypothetical protein